MSSPHPLLTARHLSLTLPRGRTLFSGLSLSLSRERAGLVGANGTGKSLLLDILAGSRAPTSGTVEGPGRVAYVPQGRSLLPRYAGETVAERLGIGDGMAALRRVLAGTPAPGDLDRVEPDGWDLPERVTAHLDRVGLGHLSLDRPMESLSGGEAARVTVTGALLQGPDLLLLDEPTNDLDRESRQGLTALLEGWNGGILVVSHDRELLGGVDRILELTPDGLTEYGGGWDLFAGQREARRQAAEAELDRARAALRHTREEARRITERQERRAARGARSRGDGSQPKVVLNARRERSQGTSGRLARGVEGSVAERLARVTEAAAQVERVAAPRVALRSTGLPRNRQVLTVEGLRYTHPGAVTAILDGVDLHLTGPERVAVEGPNGSGKTTLLKLVAEGGPPDAGTVRLGLPRDRVAWLDQRTAVLPREGTVLDALREARPELREEEARHLLDRFLFRGEAALTPVAGLSGGERVRAALACVLGGPRPPALLILDEPANHLDLPGLEAVEGALREYDGALLVVSHDRAFLDRVGVDRTLSLAGPA